MNTSATRSLSTAAACSVPLSDEMALSLLYRLVSIPSLSGNERLCALALAAEMRSLGLIAEIDESGSVVGTRGDPSTTAREIILLGHIDTVPGEIEVRRQGDILFGRGTVDAKGPLAAFTMAAARAELPPGVRVRVIGAVEEEIATSKGARFAAEAYRPYACIIGEPSSVNGITLGYKGRLLATARIRSDSSHSAGPEPTASEIAFRLWATITGAIASARPPGPHAFESIQARLRSISSSSDGLQDIAALSLGFRLPPGFRPSDAEELCQEASRIAAPSTIWEFRGHESAVVADRSNSVSRALSTAIRQQGLKPTPKHKTGTSDMNVVAPVWNCPIAAYGPGNSSLDHTPGEHIHISEYLASIRILAHALESIAREFAS
ncbi:MAG: [LysW]-lysine hydrolase [Phycisphaerales bacterium]